MIIDNNDYVTIERINWAAFTFFFCIICVTHLSSDASAIGNNEHCLPMFDHTHLGIRTYRSAKNINIMFSFKRKRNSNLSRPLIIFHKKCYELTIHRLLLLLLMKKASVQLVVHMR